MELTNEMDFTCKKCISGVLFQDEDKMINLDGDNIEVVDRFSYQCRNYRFVLRGRNFLQVRPQICAFS